ncbi:MAG: alpha/beta hydrolase [Anaerolinea sp.]|nr:alpha/beta hydrolase [Anaerolinea sp.]
MEFTMREHIFMTKGCPIHYWEGGVEIAPWVVFLHGACVDHHSFDPILPVIAEKFRVLAWDARGHGSPQPMGEPFTVPLAVEDLVALLDLLSIRQAVIIGHSNGTYIAQELAFRHPERVKALVISDGTCITWTHSVFENLLITISPALLNLYPYETLKKASISYVSSKKEIQDYTYEAYSNLAKKDFIAIWKGVTLCLHAEPDYFITKPMLLMHGDDDTMGDIKKIAPLWAAREPNCQYEVIPNAKHFAILDNPEFFNKTLLGFLAKLQA